MIAERAAMLTKPRIYRPEDLAIMTRAMSSALREVLDGHAVRVEELDQLQEQLGQFIMNEFEAGVTDPEVLRTRVAEMARSLIPPTSR
jgi:hypothetical protein